MLVDAHSFIWALLDDSRLSSRARRILRSDEHELLFSLASLWELSIKIRNGKLRTLTSSIAFLHDSLTENRIALLPVQYEDILALEHLETHHRDPFDRILIAQAIHHGLALLSNDAEVRKYAGVTVVW